MQLSMVKKQLYKDAIIYLSVLFGAAAIFGLLSYQQTSIEEELASTKNELGSYTTQTRNSEQQNEAIVNAIATYELLPEHKRLMDINDLSAPAMIGQRISVAAPLIEELNETYKIETVTAPTLLQVQLENSEMRVNTIDVYTNTMELEFNALSDEVALSYCEAIAERFPGVVTLIDLQLNTLDIDIKNAISSVKDLRADLPRLVSAKATFTWRQFHEPNPDKPQDNAPRRRR